MSPQKLGPFGCNKGGRSTFDDSLLDVASVESVAIGYSEQQRMNAIRVTYVMKNGTVDTITYGDDAETRNVVEVGPFGPKNGYIKTVKGTFMPGTNQIPTGYIRSICFVTSKNTESVYGNTTEDLNEVPFSMTGEGETQLVGLYGRFGADELISIGASFAMPE